MFSNISYAMNYKFNTRASFYGCGEKLNKHTSNGDIFNPNRLTAAHRTLPFGTKLLVQYKNKSVVVIINDRGPAASLHRDLDLSFGAAKILGIISRGIANVKVSLQ